MKNFPPTSPDCPLVLHGRSENIFEGTPSNTFDAIVTDPPYEINIGGKRWDDTGIAFDAAFWSEMLRVLKPGGNLVAFGAPRTYHRLTVAIEDGGFEVRDSILAWVKSGGFAKSQKLSRLLGERGETQLAAAWEGMGTGLKPAHEPIVVARKPLDGCIVDNIATHRVGGINIDAARVPTTDDRSRTPGESHKEVFNLQRSGMEKNESHPGGRWPTNMVVVHTPICVEGVSCALDCPALGLERQSKGSSRFFPAFHYQGRAAASERPKVNGVEHVSVKPLALMQWLVGMAALPGQLILDPFAGSGSTVEAAMRLGVRCVAVEGDSDYLPLIEERVRRHCA